MWAFISRFPYASFYFHFRLNNIIIINVSFATKATSKMILIHHAFMRNILNLNVTIIIQYRTTYCCRYLYNNILGIIYVLTIVNSTHIVSIIVHVRHNNMYNTRDSNTIIYGSVNKLLYFYTYFFF